MDKIIKYNCKQSDNKILPSLPMRSLIIGPSASGKTYLLNKLITDYYKGCFERVYIFSQSINLDSTYNPIKHMQKDIKKEDLYFDTFNENILQNIIDKHTHIITKMKEAKQKDMKTRGFDIGGSAPYMYNICIIIDDFIDDKRIANRSKALNSLFIRGRHSFISTICLIQKYISVSPMIRINISSLMLCFN